MIRFWIGTALLAGSWLFGLDYFYPANPWAWLAAIAAAVVLLGRTSAVPDKPLAALHSIALVLFLPAVWFAPWPYRAAPLLIVAGLGLQLVPIGKRWSDWLAQRRRRVRRHPVGPGVGLRAICGPHNAVA